MVNLTVCMWVIVLLTTAIRADWFSDKLCDSQYQAYQSCTATQLPSSCATQEAALMTCIQPLQCQICEDAVQTYHDFYPCAGGFLDWGSGLDSNIKGCQQPQFDCSKVQGQLATQCEATRTKLRQPDAWKALVRSLARDNEPYTACSSVSTITCPQDPNFSLGQLSACHAALKSADCVDNFRCTAVTARGADGNPTCTAECYLCYWIAKSFPLFQEICEEPSLAATPQPGVATNTAASSSSKSKTATSSASKTAASRFFETQERQIAPSPSTQDSSNSITNNNNNPYAAMLQQQQQQQQQPALLSEQEQAEQIEDESRLAFAPSAPAPQGFAPVLPEQLDDTSASAHRRGRKVAAGHTPRFHQYRQPHPRLVSHESPPNSVARHNAALLEMHRFRGTENRPSPDEEAPPTLPTLDVATRGGGPPRQHFDMYNTVLLEEGQKTSSLPRYSSEGTPSRKLLTLQQQRHIRSHINSRVNSDLSPMASPPPPLFTERSSAVAPVFTPDAPDDASFIEQQQRTNNNNPSAQDVLSQVMADGRSQAEQILLSRDPLTSPSSARESLNYLHHHDDVLFARHVGGVGPDDTVLLEQQGATTSAASATGQTRDFRADDGIPRKHNVAGLTMPDACLKMYDYVRQSRKARYFSQHDRYVHMLTDIKDRLLGYMWDANVVCKCLGHCPIGQFENLALLNACRYDERDEEAMSYVLEINDPSV